MFIKKNFKVPVISLLILIILHFFGLVFFLYWKLWWLDIVTHLIGGIFTGSLLYLHFSKFKYKYLWTIVISISIFVLWEIFSIVFLGHDLSLKIYDTIIDLLMGVAGSIIGIILWKKFN